MVEPSPKSKVEERGGEGVGGLIVSRAKREVEERGGEVAVHVVLKSAAKSEREEGRGERVAYRVREFYSGQSRKTWSLEVIAFVDLQLRQTWDHLSFNRNPSRLGNQLSYLQSFVGNMHDL